MNKKNKQSKLKLASTELVTTSSKLVDKEEGWEERLEKCIVEWMYLKDNSGNRNLFPEDTWYPQSLNAKHHFDRDPLRTVVSHVGLDQLRKTVKQIVSQVREEAFKKGSAYKGQATREAYQRGYSEARRETAEEIIKLIEDDYYSIITKRTIKNIKSKYLSSEKRKG